MDYEKVIISLYEELFRQATLNRNYKLHLNPNDKTLVRKFIDWINSTYHESQIGEDFFINYFEFQFSHYHGMISEKFGRNRIMLNWVIGKKAIQRWEERDSSKRWLVKLRVNSEFSLNLKEAFKEEKKKVNISNKSKFILELNKTEEGYKKRFYNELKGFVFCQMFTTLYNPISPLCQSCTNKDICIKTIQTELPEFYKLREESYVE
jgi:hypothetical protein